MISPAHAMPKLLGAPRYSTKRNRFVFILTDHDHFVAVAVHPRICEDWLPDRRMSYGQCQGLISERRHEIEERIQVLTDSGNGGHDDRLDLWSEAEMSDAF